MVDQGTDDSLYTFENVETKLWMNKDLFLGYEVSTACTGYRTIDVVGCWQGNSLNFVGM